MPFVSVWAWNMEIGYCAWNGEHIQEHAPRTRAYLGSTNTWVETRPGMRKVYFVAKSDPATIDAVKDIYAANNEGLLPTWLFTHGRQMLRSGWYPVVESPTGAYHMILNPMGANPLPVENYDAAVVEYDEMKVAPTLAALADYKYSDL